VAAPARLSPLRLLAFGGPALPLAALTLPVFVFLPAHYATLGLSLGTIGWVLLLSRLWDGVTDPLVGWLSDRTGGRLGRRRPWVLAGTPLVCLAVWFLLVPSPGAGAAYLLGWSFALYLGWTMVIVPLTAWGAELSGDYDERTRISGWLNGLAVLGTVVAMVLPVVAGTADQGTSDQGGALYVIALFTLAALPLTIAFLLAFVPEPKFSATAPVGFADGARIMRANAPFRRLVLAYVLNGLANGLPAQLFLFFVQHVLGEAGMAGPLLVAYFISGIAAVPLWLWLSKRFGKHRVWSWAMLWACAWFATVPLLEPGDGTLFLAVCLLTGAALGADLVLPAAMQADVVDEDTVRTGTPRTGLYFALWGLATKLALALAALGLPLAEAAGFSAGGPNDARALWALTLLYSLVPIGFKLAAIALMRGYEITPERQAENRRLIEARALS